MQTDEESQDRGLVSLAQGDLSINLFMSLLALLAALSIAALAAGREGFIAVTPFTATEDPAAAPIRSWQPVLPVHPKLVLRQSELHLLDATEIAQRFIESDGAASAAGYRDSSKSLPGDLDPSAFQVFLGLDPTARWPASLSAGKAEIVEGAPVNLEIFAGALDTTGRADLFLFPDDMAHAVEVIDALYAQDIAVRILKMPRNTVFGFVQSGRDLGLERSFK